MRSLSSQIVRLICPFHKSLILLFAAVKLKHLYSMAVCALSVALFAEKLAQNP